MSDLDLRAYTTDRIALAASCFAFPAVIYIFGFWWIAGRQLFPVNLSAKTLTLKMAPSTPATLAADLAAREIYLLASVAMLVISLTALAYALFGIRRSRDGRTALIAVISAAGVGAIAAFTEGNPLRTLVVETPLDKAEVWGAEAMRSGMRLFVTVNTFIGLTAVGAMICRFADIALGPVEGATTAETVRARGAALQEALLVGSAMLTAATVATFFYYHYPLSIMTVASAEVFGPLSALGSLRWGAAYTAVLIAAAAPAMAAHIMDARQGSGDQGDKDAGAAWLDGDVWAKRFKTLGAILAVIAPAIATPILEVLAPLLK